MKKTIKKVILMLIILIMAFSICTKVQALSGAISDGKNFIKAGDNDHSADISKSDLQGLSGYLYNMLLAAGVVVAVIVAAVLGIQFMVGGAEGQAKVKEMLIPFVVGCIVVFGGFGIWKIAVNIGKAMDNASIYQPAHTYEIASTSIATILPGDLTGEAPSGITEEDIKGNFEGNLINIIRFIGIFVAVGAMMVIGIKYMTGSIEEKATYKKSMLPYIVGCVFLFGASTIAPSIVEMFKDTADPTQFGNAILGLIQGIGTFVAIAVIMIIGIKYMMGSIEERATYKKSMLPFLVGALLLFTAVTIVPKIYQILDLDNLDNLTIPNQQGITHRDLTEGEVKGMNEANAYLNALGDERYNKELLEKQLERVITYMDDAKMNKDREEERRWTGWVTTLNEALKDL